MTYHAKHKTINLIYYDEHNYVVDSGLPNNKTYHVPLFQVFKVNRK